MSIGDEASMKQFCKDIGSLAVLDEKKIASLAQDFNLKSINSIFGESILNFLKNDGGFAEYLHGTLTLCAHPLARSPMKQNVAILVTIDALKDYPFNEDQAKLLTSRVSFLLKGISDTTANSYIERIAHNISCIRISCISGFHRLMDVLGQLVYGSESIDSMRTKTINLLISSYWPPILIPSLISLLSDLCSEEVDCTSVICKAMRSLIEIKEDSLQITIDLEDIPTVLYKFVSIGRRPEYSTAQKNRINNLIVDGLVVILDVLFLGVPEKDMTQDRISDDNKRKYVKRVDICLATTFHQLNFIFSKDPHLSLSVLKKLDSICNLSMFFDQRNELESIEKLELDHITCGKLLLCLAVARIARLEQKAQTILLDHLDHHNFPRRAKLHFWYENYLWDCMSSSNTASLRHSFASIFSLSQVIESLSSSLIQLGFRWMDSGAEGVNLQLPFLKAAVGTSSESLFSANFHAVQWSLTSFSQYFQKTRQKVNLKSNFGHEKLGSWIILNLFCQCEFTRVSIIREITGRILAAGSAFGFQAVNRSTGDTSSTLSRITSSSTALSNKDSFSSRVDSASSFMLPIQIGLESIQLLNSIAMFRSAELWNLSGELQECLLTISSQSPVIVDRLLEMITKCLFHSSTETIGSSIVSSVNTFSSNNGIFDTCVLALRKSSFSTDILGRQAAITALTRLLVYQVSNDSNAVHNDSSCSSSTLRPSLLSSEEILSLLHRFLGHQSEVRSYLYFRMISMALEAPILNGSVLRFFSGHLQRVLGCSSNFSSLQGQKRGSSFAFFNGTSKMSWEDRGNSISDNWVSERLFELFLCTFVMAKRCFLRRKTHTISETDNEEESMPLFSQAEYLSSDSRFGNGSCSSNRSSSSSGYDVDVEQDEECEEFDSMENPVAIEVFELLFEFGKYLSSISIENFIRGGYFVSSRNQNALSQAEVIGKIEITSITEASRASWLFDLIYISTIVLTQIPSRFGDTKISGKERLERLCECFIQLNSLFASLSTWFENSKNKESKVSKRKKAKLDEAAAEEHQLAAGNFFFPLLNSIFLNNFLLTLISSIECR